MTSTTTRYEITKATILDADGATRQYEIIKDCDTFATIEAPFGSVATGRGFIRCQGRQYVGTYGRRTPIYAGNDGDVYYAPMSFFDGQWSHGGADARGLHNAVTTNGETGELFAALEEFATASSVAASY